MATKNTKTEVKEETTLAVEEKKQRMTVAQIYRAQEKVTLSISPLYRPYFGNVMEILLNGVYCAVPVDGRSYALPKSFAYEVYRRVAAVDAQNKRAEKMADVTKNHENFIGELRLI
jgi:hypothetical protein